MPRCTMHQNMPLLWLTSWWPCLIVDGPPSSNTPPRQTRHHASTFVPPARIDLDALWDSIYLLASPGITLAGANHRLNVPTPPSQLPEPKTDTLSHQLMKLTLSPWCPLQLTSLMWPMPIHLHLDTSYGMPKIIPATTNYSTTALASHKF